MVTRKKADGLADADLLILCELADAIWAQAGDRIFRPVESEFLRMMRARELWSPTPLVEG